MFELSTQTIGKIDIWVVDFIDMENTNILLQRDIEQQFLLNPNFNAYGIQTTTSLHKLPGNHWRKFFGLIKEFVTQIFKEHSVQYDEGIISIRAWASKITREEFYKKKTVYRSFHDHLHATLSMVYYLKIPTVPEASNIPGTIFLNPLPTAFTSSHPGILVQARENRIIAFPGWLTHGVDIFSEYDAEEARIIVGIDVYFTPN